MDQNSIITIYSDSESDNPEQTPLPREKSSAEEKELKRYNDQMAAVAEEMSRGRRYYAKRPKKAIIPTIVISDSE